MKIFSYETLGSSSTEAIRLLAEGEQVPFVVWTRSQSAGRGRRTRQWQSPPGNLYLSLAVEVPSSWLSLVPLHTAAIVVEFLQPLISHKITLKWPNDLLLRGKKFAGILCEAAWQQNQEPTKPVVIGIGINIEQAPEVGPGDYAVCALQDWFLKKVKLEDVFHAFIQFWERSFGVLSREEILVQYSKYHLSRGQLWHDKEQTDLYFINETISKDGHLVVRSLQDSQEEELTSTHHRLAWSYQDFPTSRKAPLTVLLAQEGCLIFAHFASADDDEALWSRNFTGTEDFVKFLCSADGTQGSAWPVYAFGLPTELFLYIENLAQKHGFWIYPIHAWRKIITLQDAKNRVLEG